MPIVRTNKRILVFADESFVQGTDQFSIGVIVVAASDLPAIESRVLFRFGNNVGELHSAQQSTAFTREILDELSSSVIGSKSIRMLIVGRVGSDRIQAYAIAFREIVVAALKRYKTKVLNRSIINNADLYMDEVSQIEFDEILGKVNALREASANQFRAVRKIVLVDSVVSRSLQFADAVAYCVQPRLAATSDDFDRWGIVRI